MTEENYVSPYLEQKSRTVAEARRQSDIKTVHGIIARLRGQSTRASMLPGRDKNRIANQLRDEADALEHVLNLALKNESDGEFAGRMAAGMTEGLIG